MRKEVILDKQASTRVIEPATSLSGTRFSLSHRHSLDPKAIGAHVNAGLGIYTTSDTRRAHPLTNLCLSRVAAYTLAPYEAILACRRGPSTKRSKSMSAKQATENRQHASIKALFRRGQGHSSTSLAVHGDGGATVQSCTYEARCLDGLTWLCGRNLPTVRRKAAMACYSHLGIG